MCNISKETILRASRRKSYHASAAKLPMRDNIVVSIRYRGTTFAQTVSLATIRANYAVALQRTQIALQ